MTEQPSVAVHTEALEAAAQGVYVSALAIAGAGGDARDWRELTPAQRTHWRRLAGGAVGCYLAHLEVQELHG